MKIFILRHGMTGEASADELRYLTAQGIDDVKQVVNARKDDMRNVTRIMSSAMARVKHTLALASKAIDFDGDIEEVQNLMAGSRLNDLIELVNDIDINGGDVLISSHQSCTSILVLWLAGEDILIPSGSLLCLEVDELAQGGAKVSWQESPNGDEIKRSVNFVDMF